ncbi:acyltransferase [Candidatus Saccharibacteria bacterium]|nr:acyltransferase [Candidatus Saccharibacteria bacterium]
MKEAKKRNNIIDLYRFIAAVMIMFCHTDLLFEKTYASYMFVDFFFILSGYFTVAHFAKMRASASPEERGKTAFSYTAHKFLPFLPYLLLAVPITYFARNINLLTSGGLGAFIGGFRDMFSEIILLPVTFFSYPIRQLGPLWYLSALLVAMPFFCYVCQSKYRRFFGIIGLVFAYFFYVSIPVISAFDPVSCVLKAFAAMFIGMFIYDVVQEFAKVKLRKWVLAALTLIELGGITFAVASAFIDPIYPPHIQLVIYIIVLIISLSQQSYISRIKCNFLSFLGKLSMPIFIWHYAVGRVIMYHVQPTSSPVKRYLVYFGGTFAISLVSYLVIEFVKKKQIFTKKLLVEK